MLDDLPRMQHHLFEVWRDMDSKVCALCGGPPQAHPTSDALAKIKRQAPAAELGGGAS